MSYGVLLVEVVFFLLVELVFFLEGCAWLDFNLGMVVVSRLSCVWILWSIEKELFGVVITEINRCTSGGCTVDAIAVVICLMIIISAEKSLEECSRLAIKCLPIQWGYGWWYVLWRPVVCRCATSYVSWNKLSGAWCSVVLSGPRMLWKCAGCREMNFMVSGVVWCWNWNQLNLLFWNLCI